MNRVTNEGLLGPNRVTVSFFVVACAVAISAGCSLHGFSRTCASRADCFVGEACSPRGQCVPAPESDGGGKDAATDASDTGRDTSSFTDADAAVSDMDAAVDAQADAADAFDAADAADVSDAALPDVTICDPRGGLSDATFSCDLIDQDCPDQKFCSFVFGGGGDLNTACVSLDGDHILEVGEACDTASETTHCVLGAVCRGSVCRAFCDYETGRGCEDGEACEQAFANQVGVCLDSC